MSTISVNNLSVNGSTAANDIGAATGGTTGEKVQSLIGITAAELQQIENIVASGLNAIADGATYKKTTTAGANDANAIAVASGLTVVDRLKTLIGDMSTTNKGVAQFASTGTQDATKAPKATGADIAALLTAAGYSLAPATGTANLDNIADGTTYKRILAAVATALNAGNAGNLLYKGDTLTVDWNTLTPGVWACAGGTPSANGPKGVAATYGCVFVTSDSGYYIAQLFFDIESGALYHRMRASPSTWTDWKISWTSGNDGNGGQPPAPKPNITASAIGEWKRIVVGLNTDLVLPAGGKWAWLSMYFNNSTAAAQYIEGAGVSTGGATILAGSGSYGALAICWRVE